MRRPTSPRRCTPIGHLADGVQLLAEKIEAQVIRRTSDRGTQWAVWVDRSDQVYSAPVDSVSVAEAERENLLVGTYQRRGMTAALLRDDLAEEQRLRAMEKAA